MTTSLRVLIAFAVLAAPPLRAQFDPDAPEPESPIVGTLFLGGGGELPDGWQQRFMGSAGEGTKLVVIGDATSWPEGTPRLAIGEANTKTLESVGAIWLGVPGDALVADSPLARALAAKLAGGALIGAVGDTASRLAAVRIGGSSDTPEPLSGLGLLPGSVVQTGFSDRARRGRFLAFLKSHPRYVGLGIPEGTVLLIRDRIIRSFGEANAHAIVSAGGGRPMRDEVLGGRRSRADLIALCNSARARLAPPHPGPRPPEPRVKKGSLIIAGGGRLPRETLLAFIELAGGTDAPIVCIPCSQARELRRGPSAMRMFTSAGATNVSWIHTKDRKKSDGDEEILEKLRKARGVWLGGGRQWNFVDSYLDTEVHRLLEQVLERGGVVAGSSAGASIQGQYMARGDPLGNLNIIAEGYEEGFGFLQGVGIDQHFSQRGRHKDMTLLMSVYPQLLGIGLDEGTAILVQGSTARVMGPAGRHAFFYDRTRTVIADQGQVDCIAVGPGRSFDLVKREIVDAPNRILRVLSYNIHHGDGTDGVFDLERIAKLITDQKPDVVAIQEVDRKTRRSSGVDQAAELARLTGMKMVFSKSIDYQGGEYGNVVLSRWPIVSHQNHVLPRLREGETRGALEVILDLGDAGHLRFIGTHFDYRKDNGERHASAQLMEKVADADADIPTIITGDLNDTPISRTLEIMRHRWAFAGRGLLTFPSGEPKRWIDHVGVRPGPRWRVRDVTVIEEKVASDHRPLLAVLDLMGN